jgi:hypothetical protein
MRATIARLCFGLTSIVLGSGCLGPEYDWVGVWETSFGDMTLTLESSEKVVGTYTDDDGEIEGTLSDDKKVWSGRWKETDTAVPECLEGDFEFTMDDSGDAWSGPWWYCDKEDDRLGDDEWTGERK